jgi:acetyl esterase
VEKLVSKKLLICSTVRPTTVTGHVAQGAVGDSVGGNMVSGVTLLAKERGGPPIRFQVLFYPVTDASFDTPSYITYQDGYWLTRDGMKWFWSNYLTNQTNVKDPTPKVLM